jgi:UDP-N-acetyl-D-mannosaminuronate dehydrogenase
MALAETPISWFNHVPRVTPTHPVPVKTVEFDSWLKCLAASSAPTPLDHEQQDVVAVIGVGYVGTHLVESFAKSCRIIAYDISLERLRSLEKLVSSHPSVCLTADQADLHGATHFLIAVPTNVLSDGSVDTTNLVAAIRTVEAYARPGATVVIESSVSVGMTRALLGTLARTRLVKAGMSPEVRRGGNFQ